ncbi:MAG TPA: serine hydrolase domain-containing protein [Fimbriimonadaceae bacterium]|nr:serine hydrolase domain-containing protein [Fimbriimonadaceae bacterium]HRJ96185.1 serine hydrolase domain-containing protein [Fimbriimonadaceae bacterium]
MLAFASAALALAGPVAFAQETEIDRLFADFARPGVPGCSVAIVRDGRTIYRKSFGEANLEYAIPIREDTPFHIASVSKQFTAFSIFLLARERKLSLDDDIRKYLPELSYQNNTVTIRHLIHHIGGIRDQWDLAVMAGWRMEDVITHHDLLGLLFRQTELNFTPGSAFMYSNGGYSLLAEIVARVSGTPFPAFCRTRIFEPLGMKNTRVFSDAHALVPGRAYSYRPGEGGWEKALLSYSNMGATSIFTTADDLVLWDRNFEDPKVGGPAVRDWMLVRGVLTSGRTIEYAGGLLCFQYRGLEAVEHAGADAGFRSEYIRFPGQRLSIILLSNRATFAGPEVARQIADILLATEFSQPKPQPPTVPAAHKPVSDREFAEIVGDYKFETGRWITVRRSGDHPVVRLDDGPEVNLVKTGESKYVVDRVGIGVEFVVAPGGGKSPKLVLETQRPMVAVREKLAWPTAAELARLAGTYVSDELGVRYEIVIQPDGGLLLRHPRDDFPLTLVLPDRFASSLGRIAVERSKSGRVIGFRVTSDRAVGVRFRKE